MTQQCAMSRHEFCADSASQWLGRVPLSVPIVDGQYCLFWPPHWRLSLQLNLSALNEPLFNFMKACKTSRGVS